jgi:hypothetical protein
LDQQVNVNCKRGNPLQFCTNCGAAMIAAKRAAYVTERCVLNVWSCEACECEFETSAFLPV